MKKTYYQLLETIETDDGPTERLVWMFENPEHAMELAQFIAVRDPTPKILHLRESVVNYGITTP